MTTISDKFLNKLKEKYQNTTGNVKNEYEEFLEKREPITEDKIKLLREKYPYIPESLIDLLKFSNGNEKNALYLFNSDIDNGTYPYYLVDFDKMYKSKNHFDLIAENEINDIIKDERINKNTSENIWMLFSNCMNNGGTSSLWIDYTPSDKGKVGQVIRYVHDEDNIIVLADSFDDYLNQVMNSDFVFIDEYCEFENKFSEEEIQNQKK